jgi:hypothetical protein
MRCIRAAILPFLFTTSLAGAAMAAPAPRAPDGSEGMPGGGPPATTSSMILGTMFPEPGYYAKDFAFIYAKSQFHLFYIRHRLGVPDDSTENDLGHAVWSPQRGWSQMAPVLGVRPDKWDNLHVWAPSIIYDDSSATWFMYYTGVTKVPFEYTWYQRIGVATSQDLVHWTRYDEPVFGGNHSEGVYSDSSQYAGCQFRDPFVMPDPASGGRDWLMFYAATPEGPTSQLITHVARNHRGFTPWESVTPLWNTDFFLDGPQAHYVGFTESPHVFSWGGRWYLFYSSNSTHRINFEHAHSPIADSTAWSSQIRLFNVMGQDTLTDHWYASEYLKVGHHLYFAYINDLVEGIEIREMVWTGPESFRLTAPSVLGVEATQSPAPALGLSIVGRAQPGTALAIQVTLPAAMDARVTLYDVSGRRLRTLREGPLPEGVTQLAWDRRDDGGRDVAPGVYFVRLVTPRGNRTARAAILR